MERAGFLELFDAHHLPVYRFALRLTGSAADAEDIVQECFLSLLKPGCSYDPKRAPLQTYLFGSAWKQYLKRSGKKASAAPSAGPPSPEHETFQSEMRDAVARAVTQLPEAQRVVLILASYEQMPLAEIARLLDIELGAVKMRLQRARGQLKELLQRVCARWKGDRMNDQELDQILEGWTLDSPSPSLRDRVRSQYPYKPPRRFPLGGLSIAAAVCLISVLAFSQTARIVSGFGGAPFTVDLERISYADNGNITRTLHTCYELPGTRMRFSDTKTEGSCWAASRNLLDGAKFITLRMMPSLILRPETERERADRRAFLKAGCSASHEVVLGHANIAGYRTVKVLSAAGGPSRRTDWYALDLDCFPMESTVEEIASGGKIHMRFRETVLAVHKQ